MRLVSDIVGKRLGRLIFFILSEIIVFTIQHPSLLMTGVPISYRVQNSENGASQLTVLRNIVRNEGVLALWSGMLPTYMKIGPMTVLVFIFLEQLNLLYYKMAT